MGGIPLIEVKNLVKRYGQHTAVSDLSFTIEDGQIYGFLGPNGAGKTTTMNIMCGYIGATSGDVLINGKSISEQPLEAKKQIGYLPEQPPLYADMTADEYLCFCAEIKGIARDKRKEEIERAVQTAGIVEVRSRLMKNLSKGFRQRVGLAQAVLGLPPIIILDEPTVGLDPKQIIEMRELIKKLGENHTVILSSHILSEVSAVCDKVMIISRGRLVACDTPEKLEEVMVRGAGELCMSVKGPKSKVSQVLSGFEGCSVKYTNEREKGVCEFSVTSAQADDLRERLFFAFADKKLPILAMYRAKATLEEVFLDLTDEQGDGAPEAQKNNTKEDGE